MGVVRAERCGAYFPGPSARPMPSDGYQIYAARLLVAFFSIYATPGASGASTGGAAHRRKAFVASPLSTGAGLVAGVTLGSIAKTLVLLPSLFILIPAAVGMKGTIFGAIGARLGTSPAGIFEVSAPARASSYQNVHVGIITTFSSSLYLAALARLAAAAFGLRSISFFDFVTISVVGGVLGSAVAMLLTVGLSILSYRRGYDLDAVSTPIVTASGDMVTIPSLYLATFLVRIHGVNAVVSGTASWPA